MCLTHLVAIKKAWIIFQQLSKRLTFRDDHASAIIESQLHGRVDDPCIRITFAVLLNKDVFMPAR